MRAKEARDIPISEFLERSGIRPAKERRSGRELWYSSPLRGGDSDPSFKVDTEKNLWFDFGLVKGGNVVDLVCELTHSTVKEALAILERSGVSSHASYTRFKPSNANQVKSAKGNLTGNHGGTASPSGTSGQSTVQMSLLEGKVGFAGEKEKGGLELVGVADIQKPYLLAYLQSRQIELSVARVYLRQVCFRPPQGVKTYYALGFPSGDGFEVRNRGFKGFVGTHKAVSTLNLENHNSLSIFEGFMDFLAFLSFHKINAFQNSVIILNTVNLRNQALETINRYTFSKVYLFLDNDGAGKSTTQFFIDRIKNTPITDKSGLYQGYNDFNEMTMGNKPNERV
ncbi:toprim domain-containing protein [Methylovulum psychrotolerans]|uniref:DNA primase n=1 Tax=Methylovulum psychrotolerans TaxID=1704499 RepID=A0A1Z4C2R7_9GAMM|nr:toprim domain-containing protein [Methylovulum psychrotolerans]ASF47837.1 hypothetical protein CEK71_18170 [Methylovulum psychrotolerans]